MPRSAPLLLLLACAQPDADPARFGTVDWIRGTEDALEVGWRGRVDHLVVHGPRGTSRHAVGRSPLRINGLDPGTYTVGVEGGAGLQQRVGSRLHRIGHLGLPTGADVKGDGDRLIVAGGHQDGAATAHVIDISDPTAPVELWRLEGFGRCRDAALRGRYALLAIECGCPGDDKAREAYDRVGLRIVDLEAAGGPTVVAELGAPEVGPVHNLTVHGDWLFLADLAADAVQMVDLHDPTNPELVGPWAPTEGIVHDQTVQAHADGDRLLVATWQGLGIVDITDPTAPRTLFDGPLPVPAVHQAWPLDDEHVLVTSETSAGHLTVWRFADDDEVPVEVGAAEPYPAGVIHNVAAHGDRAYAAWYGDGLVTLDLADPTQPWVVESLATEPLGPLPQPGDGPFVGAWGVWVDPESPPDGAHLVAVSDSHAGLQLVRAWPEVVWYPRDDSNVRPTD